MKTIGNKIKTIRKRKGFSQEELAELAKVNLRTIQRIENNKSEPRGTTLNLICTALDITTETIFDYGKEENINYLVLFHLSVLVFLFIPLGNIILPVILYFSKKDKIENLNNVGANLLNFQIVWSIIMYASMFASVFTFMNGTAIYKLFLYIWICLYILNVVLPIILAIATNKTKKAHKYPIILNIIK